MAANIIVKDAKALMDAFGISQDRRKPMQEFVEDRVAQALMEEEPILAISAAFADVDEFCESPAEFALCTFVMGQGLGQFVAYNQMGIGSTGDSMTTESIMGGKKTVRTHTRNNFNHQKN